jgi:GTP-binding protein HflX
MAAFFGADEIWNIQSPEGDEEPVILVGVYNTEGVEYASEKDFYHSLDELAELTKACNMTPVYTITQQLPQVDKALYVRSGKAEEIAFYADDMEAERIIFNDTLSPSQIRNLQKVIKKPVTDRTRLILDIFERRAGSREAKLQVELAKLSY